MRHKALLFFCFFVFLSAYYPQSGLVAQAGIIKNLLKKCKNCFTKSQTQSDIRKENPWAHYESLQNLGQGTFGVTYKVKARNDNTDKILALKVTHEDNCKHADFKADAMREYLIGAKLNHENIVRAHAFYKWDKKCAILMDYVPGETVKSLYKRAFPETAVRSDLDDNGHAAVWNIVLKLASAVKYMCEQGYVHGDLSQNNVLVDMATGKVTIIDLGAASPPNKDNLYTDLTETCDVKSPERRILGYTLGPPACSADVFALCSLSTFLLGKPLVNRGLNGCNYDKYHRIYQGGHPKTYHVVMHKDKIIENLNLYFQEQELSSVELELLMDMCHRLPESRLSPAELVQRLQLLKHRTG